MEWLRTILRTHLTNGSYCTGLQAHIRRGDRILLDVAEGVDGVGEAVTPDTIFATYCLTKPVLAAAVAGLVADGKVALEETLGDILPIRDPALAGTQIAMLLAHTAGLHHKRLRQLAVMPAAARREALLGIQPDIRDGRRSSGYSEVVGWMLLGLVIERRTGVDYRELVRTRVLDPMGASSDVFVGLRPEDWSATRDRLGVNSARKEGAWQPLLSERARWFACDWNPAYGGYSSARGIAAFYAGVLQALRGDGDGPFGRALQSFARPARAREHDQAFGYPCRFGLGFMVELSDHHYGRRISPAAFGHSGNAGMSFAFADPDTQLVAAIHYNGAIDAETAVRRRRPALVDALHAELAETA